MTYISEYKHVTLDGVSCALALHNTIGDYYHFAGFIGINGSCCGVNNGSMEIIFQCNVFCHIVRSCAVLGDDGLMPAVNKLDNIGFSVCIDNHFLSVIVGITIVCNTAD